MSGATEGRSVPKLDFKGLKFCLLNGQFVETRTNTAVPACQEGLVHTVIHISCGYENKSCGINILASYVEKCLSIFVRSTLAAGQYPQRVCC